MSEEIKVSGNEIQIGNKIFYDIAPELLDYITNLQVIEQQYSAVLSENADLQERIGKAVKIIKEYGRDKQLEEEYLMNAYNLAVYNTTLLDILNKENESEE